MLRYEPFRYLLLATPVVLGELVRSYGARLSSEESADYSGLRDGLRMSFKSLRFRKSILASAKVRPLDLFKTYGRRKAYHLLESAARLDASEND